MGNARGQSSDQQAVVDVCVRYAYALDGKDWAALRGCFLPDVTSEYHGVGELTRYQPIEDLCRRALEPLEASQHLLGNHLVELNGDEARHVCYFQAEHVRTVPGGNNFTVARKQWPLRGSVADDVR